MASNSNVHSAMKFKYNNTSYYCIHGMIINCVVYIYDWDEGKYVKAYLSNCISYDRKKFNKKKWNINTSPNIWKLDINVN